MKAALLKKPGRLEVLDISVPQCPDPGVIIEVKACGICSADVKMIRHGHRALRYPRIPGHEIAGVIAASTHPAWETGAAVQVAPGIHCGLCSACRSVADHRCPDIEILGFTRDGGFAEMLAVPLKDTKSACLTRIPAGMPFSIACLAEPLACCINSQNAINIREGDVVWIIGSGPLGLLHLHLARRRGAATIIVSDPRPERRRLALAAGADAVFDPREKSCQAATADITDGQGVTAVILATGNTGVDDSLLKCLAPGGRVAIFSGISQPLNTGQLDLNFLHYHEITVNGTYGCAGRHNRKAIELLPHLGIPWHEFITCRTPLSRIHNGFEHAGSNNAVKAIVEVTL